jgi:hypothetical protein
MHEAGFAQHPQVLGDRRLAQLKLGDELAHGLLGVSKQVEDAPAVGLGEDVERCHRTFIPYQAYSCLVI